MRLAPWWKQTFPRITVQIVGDLICLCFVQNDNVQKVITVQVVFKHVAHYGYKEL